jgi:peptidoglycan-N-acetylglucosamine deacetylase
MKKIFLQYIFFCCFLIVSSVLNSHNITNLIPTKTVAITSTLLSAPSKTATINATPTSGIATSIRTYTPTPSPINIGLPKNQRGLITNGDRTVKNIALTFDVCQSEGDTTSSFDSGIVNVLTDNQTPATFFLGGLWIRDHPANTQTLAQNPLFELGSHSWSHANLTEIDSQKLMLEINLAQEQLFTLTGKQNNLFRLPYGYYNAEVLETLGDEGLYTIQWDVESGDPDPNIDAQAMTNWVLQQVKPGSIIIMHANGRGWHTAEALPGIIKALTDQGFTFVTVSELLSLP